MSFDPSLTAPSTALIQPMIDGLPFSPIVATYLGWFSCAILLTALSRLLPWPKTCYNNPFIFLGIALLTLLPVGNHPGLAAGLHGTLGPPSGTLAQLALLSFFNFRWPTLPNQRWIFSMGIAALVFYALSLGFGKTWLPDPYNWGYQPQGLWLGILVFGIVLYRRQHFGWLLNSHG